MLGHLDLPGRLALPDRLAGPARRIADPAGAVRDTVRATQRVMTGAAQAPLRTAAEAAQTQLRTAAEAAQAPLRTVASAADAALRGGLLAGELPRQAISMTRALLDLHPRRTRRRVWEGHGHAHIEVRGLTGSGPVHRRVAAQVCQALRVRPGVRWAQTNAVTGHVVVAFDERRVDVGALLETVRAAERAQGTRWEDFSWERPVHPSDGTPVVAAAVELAADCVAVSTAVVGRLSPWPALPMGVRVGLILLDLQPQLRRELSRRIGPTGTDFLLALTYAAVLGLSQRPIGPAIDALHRVQLLEEQLARRAAWHRREPELCRTPETLPREAPQPPGPRRRLLGPIEAWTETLGPGSLAGAGAMLALTRDLGRAGDTIIAAVPRAARLGREAFAATAAAELARQGVLPLDATAFRRLDTVSAIVLDSSLLGADGVEPLAAALVDVARDAGARVLLTEDAAAAELAPRADGVLAAGQSLTAHVRRLQEEGHGVLLVSGSADEALAAADVGVATADPGGSVCWSADLLCGPGLEDAWRILALTAEARPLSEQVVRLSQAGSALGTVLALTPLRPGRYASAPVYGAALLGLVQGTRAAWRATRRPLPAVSR